MNKVLGLILVAAGLAGLVWGGISYTTREKVIDLGPIEATREKKHNIPFTPLASTVAIAGGVALLVMGRHNS